MLSTEVAFLFFSIFKVAGFQTQFFLDEIQNFYFNLLLFFCIPFWQQVIEVIKIFFSFIIHQIVSFMFPGSCCVVTKNSFFTSNCLCHDSYGNKWVALYCLYITPENILQNKRKRSGHSLWIAQKSCLVIFIYQQLQKTVIINIIVFIITIVIDILGVCLLLRVTIKEFLLAVSIHFKAGK